MAAKYYTHFVTADQPALATVESASESSEWSGVVELRHALEHSAGTRELRSLLAQSFDLTSDDIRILHWARLH
jgi:HPt (histidine-containing phosphotransfer) domain-containing protein